jgi:hypothetical protein
MRTLVKTVAGAVVGEAIGRRQGHGLIGAGIGVIATRIATRSLPGALFVGGAILAKTVYDRRKEHRLPKIVTSPSDNILSPPPANP